MEMAPITAAELAEVDARLAPKRGGSVVMQFFAQTPRPERLVWHWSGRRLRAVMPKTEELELEW